MMCHLINQFPRRTRCVIYWTFIYSREGGSGGGVESFLSYQTKFQSTEKIANKSFSKFVDLFTHMTSTYSVTFKCYCQFKSLWLWYGYYNLTSFTYFNPIWTCWSNVFGMLLPFLSVKNCWRDMLSSPA